MLMRELRFVLLLLLLPAAIAVRAQPANDDCSNAQNLCSGQPVNGTNTGAVGGPGFCPGTGSVVWYMFHTNSVGGTATVSVTGIACPDIVGMDNELSIVVLSGNGSCVPASFAAASPCNQDSVPFAVTTSALLPDTVYWVLVAGVANNGAILNAECDFGVSVAGPGVDVVNVDLDAGQDVTIPLGGSTQLHATGAGPFQWSPPSGLSGNAVQDPVASPTENTTYTVTSTLSDGCTYSDVVSIEVVRLIDPPNTITPNGDGINDVWDIFGIEDYREADVSIFDRWGQRVFHSVGYKEPFDGKNLPTATYYWHIDLNNVLGRSDPYTGYLTIVR